MILNYTTTDVIFQNFDGLMVLIIIFFHIVFSLYIWKKAKRFTLLFINFAFSILMGINSFNYWIPLQIYIVIFDILLNGYFFAYGTKLAKDIKIK